MVLAIGMVLIALPAQIRKNFREKRSGMAGMMIILPFLVYFSRALYAFEVKSWYIFVPDALGVIFSGVLLAQHFLYRNKKSPS